MDTFGFSSNLLFRVLVISLTWWSVVIASFQDDAICSFIAATNVASLATYDEWVCATNGVTETDPCSPVWTSVTCSGGYIQYLNFNSDKVIGK